VLGFSVLPGDTVDVEFRGQLLALRVGVQLSSF
jgi:hypothetical protein